MRVIVAVVLAVAACGAPGEPIRDWTLARDGGDTAVTLPSKLMSELPFREHDFTLRATVPIPAELRGRELAFVVPCFHGDLTLVADDRAIADSGDAGGGEHRFVLAPELTARPALAVRMTPHLDNLSSMVGFGVPPYLTDTRESRSLVAAINHDTAVFELGALVVFGLLYTVMYALARRREDLAFVVLSVVASLAPMWQLGLLHVFGPFAGVIPAFAIAAAQICVLYFMHDSFELGPPPRWLIRGFVGLGIANVVLGPIAYVAVHVFLVAVSLFSIPYLWHLTRILHLVIRTRPAHRTNAILMTVIMVVTGVAVALDFVGLNIGHSLLAGVHTISFGVVGCVVTQALLLSRTHVARQRELERNAEELRRQVVERSRELSVALAELAKRPPETLGEDRVIAERYRIVRRLGAGGMGTVYEVARTSDARRFALKTLRGRADPEIMQRFAREAEIAAELDHPNLVPVLDVGIADGSLYLVMPLVEGGSLEQQRTQFGNPTFARPILAQIAAGLGALHARGIVHRDLKPGNVLLAPAARIADFGLAAFDPTSSLLGTLASGSLELADTAAPTPSPSPPLTRAGDIFGTPRYMAPELAGGAADASPAADVFAFGVIAFEMLSGRQPFVEPVVMARLENREPAPPSVDLLPDDIRPLVARCLAFDPSSRPPATDLATAFRPR